MKTGRKTKYHPDYDAMLVDHMSKGKSFPAFAAVVGVCFDTLYEWARVNPSFSEAKSIGKAKELAWWENLLQGGAAGKIVNYNATSALFALKNKAPAFYKDRVDVDTRITSDNTSDQLKALLEDPKHREAALQIAEAIALNQRTAISGPNNSNDAD